MQLSNLFISTAFAASNSSGAHSSPTVCGTATEIQYFPALSQDSINAVVGMEKDENEINPAEMGQEEPFIFDKMMGDNSSLKNSESDIEPLMQRMKLSSSLFNSPRQCF